MKKASFTERLALLHELHFELAEKNGLEELCRTAVDLGRSATGIDRLSIWFIDENNPKWLQGTYGIDEQGAVRDERSARVEANPDVYDQEFLERRVPFRLIKGGSAYDHTSTVVGTADLVVAPMWDGAHSIGVLSGDNLLSGRRIGNQDCELAALLARMAGYLVTIKRKEEMLRKDARELERMATTDELTGILNRRTGMQFLEHQLSVARRIRRPLVVCFIDLDGLKRVNDNHGHHVGDQFIVAIASLIQEAVRDSDIVCRMGGDEFMVVLPMSGSSDAEVVLERLHRLAGKSETLTQISADRWYSVGTVTWDPDDAQSTGKETVGTIAQRLVRDADHRMYEQKRARGAAR
ncbi:MAG: sensor domain-containing diguanylate cyclase [Spirochaetaceae bacterium]|nr:MAG: sensor domain-containing diguanylate cyclase [Spirochaetaceae bacterium]